MQQCIERFKYDIHLRSFTVGKKTARRYFVSSVLAQPQHQTSLVFVDAVQAALRESPGGRVVLHAALHGGDGGHLRAGAGGGEEEDQLPEADLPVHPQTPGRHKQREVSAMSARAAVQRALRASCFQDRGMKVLKMTKKDRIL